MRASRLLPVSLLLLGLFPLQSSAQGVLRRVWGISTGDNLGFSCSGLGDANLDGIPDFVCGAREDDDSGDNSGSASIWSGADGSLIRILPGPAAGDEYGFSVGTSGDLDNDGRADVVVATPFSDMRGRDSGIVRVHSSADGSIIHEWHGSAPGDTFGESVAGGADLTGDGVCDIVVGSPGHKTGAYSTGAVHVFSGSDGSPTHTFLGLSTGSDFLGLSVALGGDVNNDGYVDCIAGASGIENNKGRAEVYSVITSSVLYQLEGTNSVDFFGRAVSICGDTNADGHSDFLVGAPGDDQFGFNEGSATLFSGIDGSLLHTLVPVFRSRDMGRSVVGLGDIDDDGCADLAVGIPMKRPSEAGGVSVYSGLTGALLHEITGPLFSWMGQSISRIDDIDGDGESELLVGAFRDTEEAFQDGVARVFSWSCGSVSPLGDPCPGQGGFAPSLSIDGCIRIGETVTLHVEGASGGLKTAFFVIGTGLFDLTLSSGCTLHIFPFSILQPFLISGSGPGGGHAIISGSIPDSWPNHDVKIQALIPESEPLKRWITTNALILSTQ